MPLVGFTGTPFEGAGTAAVLAGCTHAQSAALGQAAGSRWMSALSYGSPGSSPAHCSPWLHTGAVCLG